MVDGSDKIKNISNSAYINQKDAIPEVAKKSKETIPLVFGAQNNLLFFTLDKKPLDFEIPKDAPYEATEFIYYIRKNQDKLMHILNIDSDTYEILAQAAVAIADIETGFGTSILKKIHNVIRAPYKWYDQHISNEQRLDYSMGMTNLKYSLHVNDKSSPEIKDHMISAGIYNEEQLKDTEKSAMGTIILLASFNKRIITHFFEGFEQSQEKFGATRIDALCALWNGGRSRALKNGKFNPNEWPYTEKAHETLKKYKLIKSK